MTGKPSQMFTGYLDSIFIIGVILVVADAIRRWEKMLRGAPASARAFGTPLTLLEMLKMGCC